jgi:hypothetical protein
MATSLYNADLTPQEESLGFFAAFLIAPDADYYGHDSIVPAVIYRLGDGDIIIKMNNPLGEVSYSHQKFGTYGGIGKADWKPVLVAIPSAEMAIAAAKSGRDQMGELAQKVAPVNPVMPLRCPQCSHEFGLNVDHLPFGAKVTCPACKAKDDAGVFSAVNM